MKVLKGIIYFALFILFLFTGNNSWAFRCGSGMVSTGDTKTQVMVTCGKPTSKETSCANRRTETYIDKNGKTKKNKKCGNKVEIWHYNCGNDDYIYALTFENGKLTNEETEGRGKGKSNCRGK
jgi:hypothetical protein